MTTERMNEILAMFPKVYPAAVASQPVNHIEARNFLRQPCYCLECCEKVTGRGTDTHGDAYPGITKAPHDKSFLDMQFGLDHAKRLTAKEYCEAMTTLGHAPNEAEARV